MATTRKTKVEVPAGGGTRLPEPGNLSTLYVVDVSGYVFRAYHALPPLTSPSGEPTHAVLGVTTMLQKLLQERAPALFVVAMDSRAPSFRRELYAEYKANRPPAPPDLKQQMERVEQVARAYRMPVLQQEGLEADDLIATLVRWAREQGLRVVIVSSDKDLMQLVGDDVLMLDSMRGAVFGPAEVKAKLGVGPGAVVDYLALVGDSSDNVPGVPSVGPKTAAQLLLSHGSLDGLYAHLEQVDKAGLREKLLAHKDLAYLSHQLVTLRSDAKLVLERESLVRVAPDRARLRALFEELGFNRLLAQLDESEPAGAGTGSLEPCVSKQVSAPVNAAVALVLDQAKLEELARALDQASQVALTLLVEGEHPVSAALIGIGFAWAGRAAYVPVGHTCLGCPRQLELPRVLGALGPWLADCARPKLCADSKRESLALAVLGQALCGVSFDCMLASYLIDPERHAHGLADLARFDLQTPLEPARVALIGRVGTPGTISGTEPVETAQQVAALLETVREAQAALAPRLSASSGDALLREVELPLARVLAQMELTGIRVDVPHLQRLSSQVGQELIALEARCKELAGREFNVGAPRQLEAILFDELHLPVVKRTKTARSTDHEVLEELSAAHPLPAAILEHRLLAKLKSTYLDALPKQVNRKTGRIHTDFRQAVAATGRISSSDPNLQNIPIRSPIGRSIRDAFIAREGFRLFAADYSQIELRVLAHLSHDAELVDAFRAGADVHVRTASALFDVGEAEVTREMRAQAKTVNFAVIYGQTQFALARNLRIERARAARYIEAFFERYAGVKAFMERVVEDARRSLEVHTLAGRVRRLPDLASHDRARRQAAERVARNTPIQGTAADILKVAMIAIGRELERAPMRSRLLLTVHDELLCEAPPDEADALERIVCSHMEHAAVLEVPLVVDRGWGETWGRAH